ncbi:MAG TPA: flagellar hook protein FlgE [Candidatus Limnocylindrales bacterium]
MLRSMFSAISGLRGHQIMMDVIGNNIANVNTVGFKSGRVNFQDILSQTVHGATAPSGGLGSINPAQIGLGMTVAGIDVLQTQGNLQSTGKTTDMAIQGDAFFIESDGGQTVYTRDGAFDIALDGSLANPASGLKVQGWQADSAGGIDITQPITNLVIPIGQRTTALATSHVTLSGNLDAGAADATTVPTTMTVFDSLGISHSVKVTFTKTGANAWSWSATKDAADTGIDIAQTAAAAGPPVVAAVNNGTLSYTSGGVFSASTGSLSFTFPDGATATTPSIDLSAMTQFSGTSQPAGQTDGFTSGTLSTFSVGNAGELSGVYSNGQTQVLGQIALANFLNSAGLLRAGQNNFSATSASGAASVGTAGTGGRGTVTTGALEMSNVDLATQFTGMITAERGFQANGRVITTSDEMLQELVNLKR